MDIKFENKNDKTIAHVSGRIDIPASEVLKKKLTQAAEESVHEIELDFKDVISIGSSGIGAIILVHKKLNDRGGKIKIINANNEIRSLFRVIKLDELILIV